MDNIGMKKYSKYFADFEQPISGEKLTNYKNIYMFRLEIDFEIETNDALNIIKEIDKLRKYLPSFYIKEPWIIDYDKECEWLHTSFNLLAIRFRNNQYQKRRVTLRKISLQ